MLQRVVTELHSPEPYLVTISERMGLSWRQFLLVDKGVVGAIQILDEYLAGLDENAGVLPGHTSFVSTIICKINLGKDVADWILSPDDDLGPARWEGYSGI